jgi:glycerophosphoryl diester phosphodiesterase
MTSRTAARPTTPRPDAAARIIAHRGASGTAPENTLAAFRQAVALGARWVEFDVSLLGDGTPVVWHDATLDRCSDGAGSLAGIAAKDLARIDAGAWFGPGFAGERIATLDAALDLIDAVGLGANLEMKAHDAAPGPLATAVAGALAPRAWTRRRLTVSSFDHPELFALRALLPDQPIAVLYETPAPDWRETLEALDAEALHLWHEAVGADLLDAAEADRRAVRIYTVNEPGLVAPALRRRIAAIFTDFPERFLDDPDWGDGGADQAAG